MNDNYSFDFELIGLIMFSSLQICIMLLKKKRICKILFTEAFAIRFYCHLFIADFYLVYRKRVCKMVDIYNYSIIDNIQYG